MVNNSQYNQKDLNWLKEVLLDFYSYETLPTPRLYPSHEGAEFVWLEWSNDNFETSLEVELASKVGEYQSVNLKNQTSVDKTFNLKSESGWKLLNNELCKTH